MAVALVSAGNSYVGLAADTKPTDATIPVSSTFFELDTGAMSVWNGSTWFRQAGAATTLDTETGVAELLVSILSELGKIRRMTAIANELDDDELEPDSPMLS